MVQRSMKITGWVLTALLALLFGMSAFMKIISDPEIVQQAASIGLDAATYRTIGIVEIFSLILFLIPRTGVLGALLLVAYMGGAIVTHLQHQEPIALAVTVQILLWLAAFLRFPELKQRLLPIKMDKR